MFNVKTAILAGTLAIGLVGFTAYASGTFCTTDAVAQQPTQTILTSGGDKSCCADETSAKQTVAQNAVFTPTAKTAALSGGGCPYEAQAQQTAAAACGSDKTTMTTTSMAEGKSCGADKTTMTMASMAEGKSCGTEKTTMTTAATSEGKSCGAEKSSATMTMASLSAGQSCCAEGKTTTTASKTTLAGVVPAAKTAN